MNYTISSGPDATIGSSDPNVVWTESGTTFSITNTAADTASATMTLTCVWSPEGGEGGGEGPGPEDIHGQADADVQLLDSVVDWDFDRTRQWANGEKELGFTVTVTDDNGFGLENWTLTEFAADEGDPANPGWEIIPVANAAGAPQWTLAANTTSSTPSKGKVKIEYNDGSDEERTSTEEIAFFLVEFITPAGDPVNSPQNSGDGQNEFTFSTASPGVLTLNIKGKVEPSGIAASIVGDSIFEVGEIEGSTMEWATGNEDGEPTASGDDIVATVTFTNLPASNGAFGAKVAKYHYDGEELLSQEYEVFFPRDATNHPQHGPYLGPRPPNWFFYWSQLSPHGGLVYQGTHSQGAAGEVKAMTQWSYSSAVNKSEITIYDPAITRHRQYGVGQQYSGIDAFIATVIHEWKHVDQIQRADQLVTMTANSPWQYGWSWNQGANHNHWTVGADGQPGIAGVDDDADGTVDNLVAGGPGELGHGDDVDLTHPTTNSRNWPSAWTPPSPLLVPSEIETEAIQHANDNHNEHDLARDDWSNPGKNHNTLDEYSD